MKPRLSYASTVAVLKMLNSLNRALAFLCDKNCGDWKIVSCESTPLRPSSCDMEAKMKSRD